MNKRGLDFVDWLLDTWTPEEREEYLAKSYMGKEIDNNENKRELYRVMYGGKQLSRSNLTEEQKKRLSMTPEEKAELYMQMYNVTPTSRIKLTKDGKDTYVNPIAIGRFTAGKKSYKYVKRFTPHKPRKVLL